MVNRLFFSGRTITDRSSRRRADRRPDDGGTTEARDLETGGNLHEFVTEETRVRVRGVIRSDAVHLLPPYGTAYGLFDEQTADYDCALKSDIYLLEDWVGDYVQVTGPLTDGNEGLPVMYVTRLQLLSTKWMR
jgi:hypothetical protein